MWNKFMSPKKIFIVVGIVAVVAVSATVLFLLSQKEKTVPQEQTQNSGNATPASLPPQTEPSVNQGNVEQAQKIFGNITQETISDKTKNEGSKRVSFENQKGSPISLSDFKKALGVKVDPKLQEYLDNSYQTFYCPEADGKKEFGVYLGYNMEKIYRGFTYDVLDMMKSWEGTILPDLHSVLFPGIDFSEDGLNQKIGFRDGKYRYAEVDLPGGEKGSINYSTIEFGILISSSPSCLGNVRQYYESAD